MTARVAAWWHGLTHFHRIATFQDMQAGQPETLSRPFYLCADCSWERRT